MMEVEKPWEGVQPPQAMGEEEDSAAASGGLQTREMKKKKMAASGDGDNGGEVVMDDLLKAVAAAAAATTEEEDKSVFFDPSKGLWKCRHCDWTHRLSGPCTDYILNHQGYCQITRNIESLVQSEPFYYSPNKEGAEEDEVTEVVEVGGQKENSKETSIAEGKETEKEENVNDQETNHSSSNGKLETKENGSHSNAEETQPLKVIATISERKNILTNWNGALDISSGSTSRTEVHEIEVEKDENATKGKVHIEEYDLEKILDEQETHDLYCPNCKSCITRRVILKKRKRTARQAKRDEPPKKPQLEEPSANVPNQTPTESHDQESPKVFRCLSCFAFFIPTGCGFNIFRIFERSNANQQVQVQHSASQETSEHCGSWLLSCFQTVDSPKQSTDADSLKEPLLSGSQSNNDKAPVEDSASSSHNQATVGEAEQLNQPLLAGSSSKVQTTTGNNGEESKQPFSECHGSASSSVAVHTSSSSSSQSQTGILTQTEGHVVIVQQDEAQQEQISPSKPAGDIQGNTTGASGDNLFINHINQPLFNPELKLPTKILPGADNQTGGKPTPVIPQSGQSPHSVVTVPEATESEPPVCPAPSVQRDEWDILKAIVYGGLVESIMSLSVVSAAAASGAKTLDIFILGMANLIGGLPLIYHNIADLRNTGDVAERSEQVGHYWLELGRRSNYWLHMVIAILSYILFGLLPPVIYGLSFRTSDNRENKMMVVAAASLLCIALLAIGKAHVKSRTYITTLLYYVSIGFSCSGLSYIAGVLITRLLAHFGLIDHGGASAPAPPSLLFPQAMGADAAAWASY
uniref:Membrane protein of ER body-like protein n=1 Tax=Setaria italica TaxID=4555 RepID=K3XVC2_SETIT